ncbi:surface antigen-like protein [Leptomonas seymouri]|uniref:Surface antigen-like protein n=1 Tax=Leptomonas seymouri TaxID=5684 RepID=A0A0N1I0Z4_LEPSE|nr:surface antigen-like protein [Leptomonas seymouri]|eukprot:KPI82830.1 surface antigen-like protein [Leptomonas seymouri]
MHKPRAVALLLFVFIVATYALPSTAQGSCSVPNCSTCSSSMPNVCVVCKSGYTLMNTGECMPTGMCSVANCSQCFTEDYQQCQECQAGYRVTVRGICRRLRNAAVRIHSSDAVLFIVAAVTFAAAML